METKSLECALAIERPARPLAIRVELLQRYAAAASPAPRLPVAPCHYAV